MPCFENNRCLTIDLLFESFLKMTSNQSLKKKKKKGLEQKKGKNRGFSCSWIGLSQIVVQMRHFLTSKLETKYKHCLNILE